MDQIQNSSQMTKYNKYNEFVMQMDMGLEKNVKNAVIFFNAVGFNSGHQIIFFLKISNGP